MAKRKLDEFLEVDPVDPVLLANNAKPAFQNSLDSDEEDDEAKEENYDIMHENDIEGKYYSLLVARK